MNFRNLNTWELGMKLTKTIYEVTEKFPDSERFALANQLQRAAVSIPSNIFNFFSKREDLLQK